jgi:hypothetical protein
MPYQDTGSSKETGSLGNHNAAVIFLHDLSCWREQLARSIARNNLRLRSGQITGAVNRILFPLLSVRIAEDRHLLPEGTLADLRDFRTVPNLQGMLFRYAEALYAGEPPAIRGEPDPVEDLVLEDRVIRDILDTLASPDRKYSFTDMPNSTIAQALLQYLTRTVRRSAAHHAMVVDTHDTALSGSTVIPPPPMIDYMVRQALFSARKNRTGRDPLPLRVFDLACGPGSVLVTVYRHLINAAGGLTLTFEERRCILADSVYGLDINLHAVAATRMLLFFELCGDLQLRLAPEDFFALAKAVFHDLRHTILCGNALVSPDIIHDESWMFCPARDRHALNPFSYNDQFPEIIAGGGFDVVVSNPPEGVLEQCEWIQQYFQRRYSVYHPLAERSAYFLEKSFSLVRPGGVVSCVMRDRWLRGAGGSPLREVLNTRQIKEIVDLSGIPAGTSGVALCILRVRATPPSHPLQVVLADAAFFENPGAYVSACRFPMDQSLLDKGGWALRDTRTGQILQKVSRHSTPLEDFVMGQVHNGIRIRQDDPLVINEPQAREWLRRDPRCRPFIRRLVMGKEISRPPAGAGGKFLILIPRGWTYAHKNAVSRPWQWFKKRHPLVARHLQPFAEELDSREGTTDLWWETPCDDEFWQKPRKKIFFPARFRTPVFLFDTGRGVGDAAANAIPSSGLYLYGILNSRLLSFVFHNSVRESATDRKWYSWEDLKRLPIYTPDFDRPEDLARHDRMELLVRKMLARHNHLRAAATDQERDLHKKKIRAANAQIDALVYELYGLTEEEIAVVEAAVT